jgi:hypothetical protein
MYRDGQRRYKITKIKSKISVDVVRTSTASDGLMASAPCDLCSIIMFGLGVYRVNYSDHDGSIKTIKVLDISYGYISSGTKKIIGRHQSVFSMIPLLSGIT